MSLRRVRLASGHAMPLVGLGTWKLTDPDAILNAIRIGYRHIDTAVVYDTQRAVGSAISRALESGVVKRSELFLTSKVWNTAHSKGRVAESIQVMLGELGVSYVDLALMHWPCGYAEDSPVAVADGAVIVPKDSQGRLRHSDVHFLETWSAMTEAVKSGAVRSIGVSNFNARQLREVLGWIADNDSPVPLSVLQIEVQPYLAQRSLVEFAQSEGIAVTAYASLGSLESVYRDEAWPVLLRDPVLAAIAAKSKLTRGQVLLAWALQRDLLVIPKSADPKRQAENLASQDVRLSAEDVEALDGLDRGLRMFPCERDRGQHPLYPFDEL